MIITDEMVEKAVEAFEDSTDVGLPDVGHGLRAALEAVAPMIIAAYLRKAAAETGGDIWLERVFLDHAQELDPK